MTEKEEQFAVFYDKKIIANNEVAVESVTEVKSLSGEPTGMFFIKECSMGESGAPEYTARFVSERGETYSKEYSAEFYDFLSADERLLLGEMHKALVEYVALDVGVPEYIPRGVKTIFPELKQEILHKIKTHLTSIKTKYAKMHEQRRAIEKIRRIQWAFGDSEVE